MTVVSGVQTEIRGWYESLFDNLCLEAAHAEFLRARLWAHQRLQRRCNELEQRV